MNDRGGAVVETALIIVLFTAMIWGFFELFLMAWLKFASIEAAYRSSRARAVSMSGNATNPEVLWYWPKQLSANLLVVPDISSTSHLITDLPSSDNPALHEVTATVQVDSSRSSRFFILNIWAHASTDMQTQQTQLLSPWDPKSSYLGGQSDP